MCRNSTDILSIRRSYRKPVVLGSSKGGSAMVKFLSNSSGFFALLGVVILLTAPAWAWQNAATSRAVAPAEPIAYQGTFGLRQSDGTSCRFADAPFTSGQFKLNSDWLAGTASGSLQGGGSGVRPGLRCGDTTGDMHWQQSYSATFSGSADSEAGSVTLTGSLSGSNNVTWQNCKQNGEPVDCPAGYSGPYTFPIALQGTINTVGGSGNGTWQVNNIALTTTGDWTVNGPALTATPTATPTSTETPTPTPTATEEICPSGPAPQTCTSLDLTVKNVEVVQAIQCLDQSEGDTTCADHSVLLVSYKQTAVRVYVGLGDLAQAPVSGVTAQLRGFRNNQELAGSPLTSVNGAIQALLTPSRGNTNDTLNFRLPHDWLTGNIEIEVEVNPSKTVVEKNYQNNTLRRPVNFVDKPMLRLAYLPVTYLGSTPQFIDNKFIALYKLFPVGYGRLTYERWPGFEWKQQLSSETAYELITELKRRYLLAGSPVDQLIGWLPLDRPVTPLGKSDPAHFFGCWFDCGRVVWVQELGFADAILAHEMAHNLGRRHTDKGEREDSCGAIDPGTDWPYSTSAIQEPGFDPWTMQVVRSDENDLMTNCFPKWVSPFTYNNLLSKRVAVQQRRADQAQPYLLISGAFYKTGGGQLQPTYHFTSTLPVELTATGTDGCLVLQNSAAQTLVEHCFALDFQDPETGAELAQIPFVAALPDPGGVSQILLKRAATAVDTLTASAHAPAITLTAPTGSDRWGGSQTVTWQASDADGDPLTYAVLYSPDQGAAWLTLASNVTQTQYTVNSQELAGGNNALIRVLASDGFNSSIADSPPFQVARKGPQPFILAPVTTTVVAPGQLLLLSGEGYDREDDLLADEHFQWRSDRAGALGQGRSIGVALNTPGTHQITLTVTDSDGNSGTATLTITVRSAQLSLFLPLVRRGP